MGLHAHTVPQADRMRSETPASPFAGMTVLKGKQHKIRHPGAGRDPVAFTKKR